MLKQFNIMISKYNNKQNLECGQPTAQFLLPTDTGGGGEVGKWDQGKNRHTTGDLSAITTKGMWEIESSTDKLTAREI